MKPSFLSLACKNLSAIAKCLLFALLLFPFAQSATAQTPYDSLTFTLVKKPCNNDGILVVHAHKLTAPVTFSYYRNKGQNIHVSATLDDTLYNYDGGYVSVSASSSTPGTTYGSGYYAGSPPFTFTDTIVPALCPALGTAKALATGGTAPYVYQWLDSTGNIISNDNPAHLAPGYYQLIITDSAGCVYGSYSSGLTGGSPNYGGIYMQNLSPIKDSVITYKANCTNGKAAIIKVTGGIPPYSFHWSNGATTDTITGLIMGSYQCTVSDAQGCFYNNYAYVSQAVTITVTPTVKNATCLQNDGSILAFGGGGKPPYTYQWGNGQQTQTAVGLTAGYYPVTITDANHCLGYGGSSITASTPITVTYSSTASLCTAATGTASLSIKGGYTPYTVKWLTYPVQTAYTATNLIPGTYSFQVTDSIGCIRTGSVYVPPISAIGAKITENDASCTLPDGSASVLTTGGKAPFTYLWSTGAVTPSIKALTTGSYSCTVTDSLSCQVIKNTVIRTSTPIQLGLKTIPATCLFNTNGSAIATPSGGTPPYTYNWSNGQTAATANGLATGRYYVSIKDSVGCTQGGWTDVGYNKNNDSCYCTISGRVFLDQNNNCTADSGEAGIPNIMMHCSGRGYTFTDASGYYYFLAPTGNYTVSEVVQSYYPLDTCQNNAIAVNVTAAHGCVSSHDFANTINPIHDMRIVTTKVNEPVPGFNYSHKVVVENNGTATETGIQLSYAHDGQLIFNGAAPALFTQQNAAAFPNWYSITDSFPALAPGASQVFDVNYTVPVNIPMGTSLVFNDTTAYAAPISNWLNDYSPWDNVNTYQSTVLGSFDPNDKEVSPKGTDVPGYISLEDSILTYTVRFQNTGTYLAQKVVVIDTLDSNLDITTLKPGYSNYSYTTTVNDSGKVTFTFDNINLPDSVNQPIASIGVLMYTIKQKHNLANGTQIKSPASIYFDYNKPVQTNTTLNTIQIFTGINEVKEHTLNLNVYPNPASNNVSLVINAEEAGAGYTYKICNLVGETMASKIIRLEKGKNIITADISSLTSGLYFIQVTDGQHSATQKLSVLK